MAVSKGNRRVWLRHKLFVLSTPWFVAIMVFQQIFDLLSTLYLTSLPGGVEANPILAPLWHVPGGILWLVAIKLAACLLIATGVPYVAKHYPEYMLGPKILCFLYWLVVIWNSLLVTYSLVALPSPS